MSSILSLDTAVAVAAAVVARMGKMQCVIVVVVGGMGMEKGKKEKKGISTSRLPI
jgi:hypothetical protein